MATTVEAPAPRTPPPPDHPHVRPVRRWPRRLLITLNVFVALCLLGTASAYGYFEWKFGNLHKIKCTFCRGHGENPGKVMNVLLVGSDTRSTLKGQKQFGSESDVAGARSDTIMILHADPKQTKAAILSLPRDLLVTQPDGSQNRINAAFDKGPDNLIQTITKSFGIPIDHYVEVDFNGFRGIVQAVGGVNIYFPAPARDAFSNLRIGNAGCVALNGDGALSYVRSRHYQYFEGGRWHDEGDGDLGRIQRQQDFIRRVLRKVKGVRDPFTVNSLINTGISNVTIDSGLKPGDILKLASRFKSLSPDTVDMETLPTVPGSVRLGGANASILRPKAGEAQQMIDAFLGRTPPPAAQPNVPPGVLPGTVRVRVLNGSGIAGQATKVASDLGPSGVGFNIAGTGDADSFKYPQSIITYGPGQLPKAQLMQAAMTAPAQLKEDRSLKGVDLVVVVGSDFSGVRALPTNSTAATTGTTAPPSPTTAPGQAGGNATGKSAADSC
jgi:LCP family protein required for cell wall assembly